MDIRSSLKNNKLFILFILGSLIYLGYLTFTFGGRGKKVQVKGPGILFQNTFYDAGSIKGSTASSIRYEYHFENNGNEMLKIEKVKPSCSCSVVNFAKKEYAPGEKGFIDVTLKMGTLGRTISDVLIFSNSETSPDKLTIAASFDPITSARPEPFTLQWDEIAINDLYPKETKIYVFHRDLMDIEVAEIFSFPKSIETKLKKATGSIFRNQVGYYIITFYFDILVQEETPGKLEGKIRVVFSPDEVPEVEVPITAEIVPEYVISPHKAIFVFSSGINDNLSNRKIELYNVKKELFRYNSIDNPFANWLDAQVEIDEGLEKIIVYLKPKHVPDVQSLEGNIKINIQGLNGDKKEVKLPVSAKVI